jgi:hypothetical protein
MRTILQAALIAGVMGATALTATPPALAQVGVSVDFGDVAIGYQDGYYDSHHSWHNWAHPNDYQAYGRAHPENYRDMKHTDDPKHGR